MKARDLMTPAPRAVTGDTPLSDAARLMRDLDVGMLPVVDDLTHMHPLGVITDRDITIRSVAESRAESDRVERVMTADHVDTVPLDADVSQVIALMERDRVRRLLVTDRGRLVGVIAQADVALKDGPREPLAVEHLLETVSRPPVVHG